MTLQLMLKNGNSAVLISAYVMTRRSLSMNTLTPPYVQCLRDVTYNTAAEGLGFTTPKHKDWFGDQDVEVQALLNTMHTAHLAWIIDKSSPVKKSAYTRGRNEAQMVAVKS